MAALTELGANGQRVVKLLGSYFNIAATNDLITVGDAVYTALGVTSASSATDVAAADAAILNALFKNTFILGSQPKLGGIYSDSAFVTQMITNIVGPVAVSQTQKDTWVTQYTAEFAVAGAYASRGAFAVYLGGVFRPAVAPDAGTPAALVYEGLENRWEVSAAYAQTPAGATLSSFSQVTAPIANVTNDDTTVTAAIAATLPTQNFALTTGVNSGSAFTGGAGNDTFDGSVSSSLSAGDVLNGGGGTDSLTAVLPAVSVTPTLTSIENITVTATGALTLDLQTSTGYSNIVNQNSVANTVAFNNIANAATAVGITSSSGAGETTINYTDAALSGSADTLALTLNGVTASGSGGTTGVTITDGGGSNKLETIAITATGVASTVGGISTSAVGTTSVTVAGAGNLTITTAFDSAVNSFVATNATGNLKAELANTTAATLTGGSGNDTLTSGAGNDVVSGGAGNDSITSGAGNDSISGGDGNDTINLTLASADTVDGGSGTDTLVTSATALTATVFTNVTNVETINQTAAGSVTLATAISATTIDVAANADVANTVTLSSGYTGATTVAIDAGDTVTNTANVTLTVGGTDAAFAGSTVTGGTGTDTLNITVASELGTSVDLFAKTSGIETVNIVDSSTAGRDIILTMGGSNYLTAMTIDASALDAGVTGASSDTTNENLTFTGTGTSKAFSVTGGGGLDTITGGSGNDTISGAAGNDSINGSNGGADSISGGDGVDTINMGSALTSADTIDGGAGNDTLIVSSLTVSGLTNVTNVETLTFSGTASLTSNLAFTSFDMSTAGADTLTLGTGYTNAVTVAVGTGDTVTNSANVGLTVTANRADLVSTTITGGTGTDTINVTVDSDSPAAITFTSAITKVETISVVDSSTAGRDLSLTLGAYATSLTINGSELDTGATTAADETLTVDGSGVTSSSVVLSLTGGGGNDSLYGGAGNDIITGNFGEDSIRGGAGIDNLTGGDSNDTFSVATDTHFVTLISPETVSGGAGTDTLAFATGANITVAATDLTAISSIETISFTNTGTNVGLTLTDSIYTADGVTSLTVDASTLTTGILTLVAGSLTSANSVALTMSSTTNSGATHSIVLGAGNDTVTVDEVALDTGTITGGSGTDTLTITANTGSGTITMAAGVTGFETMTFATAGIAGAFKFVTDSATVASGSTLTVNGSNITGTLNWNGNAETNGYFSITGGSGADTLRGGALSDTISGGSGSDSITGGLGADVMTGGAGGDTFYYSGIGFETGSVSPAVVYYGGTVVAGTSVSTTSLDKVLDFGNGGSEDTLVTNAGTTTTYTTDVTTNASGSIWTALSGYLKGTYDSTAQTFVFSTTGSDTMFVYDFDGLNTTNDLRGIVLVGYVDTGSADTGGNGTGISATV